ncbi:conserved hypothetical protein [Altererythrobacter sp. B11]|uniref:hypothetical protein n=1 Tax=Altererythrobacter sp. B11 TaxID=2060312 RepID=UPI000DC7167F|nr:hypothetical protein [Altererythrobacter sp. B11]BBC71489.1 conserved hypothetical protein [Altererythrobacter sp. B11]
MAATSTACNVIAELREFASFTEREQRTIERGLDIGLGRGDAFRRWSRQADDLASIRSQYLAYHELRSLRSAIPHPEAVEGIEEFLGPLVRIAGQDLAREGLESFSAFRFLYERLLGAASRPWLPSAFCAAAALPLLRPLQRKALLQSLSETAAMAPAWSSSEPGFFPEKLDAAEAA